MTRNEREAKRLRAKRKNAAYVRGERTRNKARMRERRMGADYQNLERAANWWKA